ncbi:MAG: Na+/H+ antiporter NhaC [Brevinema sp.]
MKKSIKPISTFWAFFPILFVLILATLGTLYWNLSIEWILIVGSLVTAGIAYWLGFRWKDMEEALANKITEAWTGVLILILIGAIVGTWMYSGTVPMLIYYGISWLHPSYVPLTAFIVAALVSMFTGTSWGSAATAGIAFMGVAQAVGAPLPLVAGAVISGAYLGDKNSPVSDTTVLAAIGAKTDLYSHVNAMIRTSIPAFFIAAIGFLILGLNVQSTDVRSAEGSMQMLNNLQEIYNFNIFLLLPAVVVFGGGILRFPPVPLLVFGSFTALILGWLTQGFGFSDGVTSMVNGFNLSMSGIAVDTVNPTLAGLLNRGGLTSMLGSVLFVTCSMAFGALLQLTGALHKILEALLKLIHGVTSLIAVTWALALIINTSVSSAQFTFLTLGPIFQNTYARYKLNNSILSRSMEEGATLTEPLIPWTVTGIYMAATLQIPTFAYAPYALFNIASIITMFVFAIFPSFKFGTPPMVEASTDDIFAQILSASGGARNIKFLDKCSTRIRITINNQDHISIDCCNKLQEWGYSYEVVGDQLQIITMSHTPSLFESLQQAIA